MNFRRSIDLITAEGCFIVALSLARSHHYGLRDIGYFILATALGCFYFTRDQPIADKQRRALRGFLSRIKSVRLGTVDIHGQIIGAPLAPRPRALQMFRWFLGRNHREVVDCTIRDLVLDGREMAEQGRSAWSIRFVILCRSLTTMGAIMLGGLHGLLFQLTAVHLVLKKLGF